MTGLQKQPPLLTSVNEPDTDPNAFVPVIWYVRTDTSPVPIPEITPLVVFSERPAMSGGLMLNEVSATSPVM